MKPWVLVDHEHPDFQIWSEADFLYIHDLNIYIFSAVCKSFSPDTDCYELDYDLFLFYNPDGKKVYSENGSNLNVCINNYCKEVGIKIENPDTLLCCYILDNGKFLQEKVVNKKNSEIEG